MSLASKKKADVSYYTLNQAFPKYSYKFTNRFRSAEDNANGSFCLGGNEYLENHDPIASSVQVDPGVDLVSFRAGACEHNTFYN